jgi:O-antigen ligase
MLMMGVVAALALSVVARRGGGRVLPWVGLLALEAGGLLITFKRGSWCCLVLVLAAFLSLERRWRWLLGLVLVGLAAVLLPPVRHRLAGAAEELDPQAGGRLTMWLRVAPALIRAHPLGVGYGALTNDMMRRVAPQVEAARDHLHSNPLQVLVETGWLGMALYALWMVRALADGAGGMRGLRARGDAEAATLAAAWLAMLIGLLLNGVVEYNFGDTELMMIYALIMGVLAAGPAVLLTAAPALGVPPTGGDGRTPAAAPGTPLPARPA